MRINVKTPLNSETKIKVFHGIVTRIKWCDSWRPMGECKNPDCSWFNHSQVGLQGGDYPPGVKAGDYDG